jgi:hypothetical protein
MPMPAAVSFTARCSCGKVQAAIQTLEKAPPLRLVCYCKDCRGYYETLNRIASEKSLPPAAVIDVSTSVVLKRSDGQRRN